MAHLTIVSLRVLLISRPSDCADCSYSERKAAKGRSRSDNYTGREDPSTHSLAQRKAELCLRKIWQRS